MNANIDIDPEVKGPLVCATYVSDPNPLKEMIERYSSSDRLQRIVAWILWYKTNLLCKVKRRREGETIAYESIGQVTPIEVDEIKNAEIKILKHMQSESFKEECQLLEENNQPKESERELQDKEMQQNIQSRSCNERRSPASGRPSGECANQSKFKTPSDPTQKNTMLLPSS